MSVVAQSMSKAMNMHCEMCALARIVCEENKKTTGVAITLVKLGVAEEVLQKVRGRAQVLVQSRSEIVVSDQSGHADY